jgi:type IV pilus assembly protein PilB
MSAKLGEILVRENLVTPQQLREALDYQKTSGGRLGTNLVKLGIISDDVITAVLSPVRRAFHKSRPVSH